MQWGLPEQEGEQKDFAVTCPAHAVKHLVKIISAKKKEDGGVLLNVSEDGSTIEFDFTEFKYKVKCIDGTYPDYSKIIPEGKDSLKTGLNAGYLVAVLNALGNSPVDIAVDDAASAANQPHLFSSKDEDGIKCVIMPVRV